VVEEHPRAWIVLRAQVINRFYPVHVRISFSRQTKVHPAQRRYLMPLPVAKPGLTCRLFPAPAPALALAPAILSATNPAVPPPRAPIPHSAGRVPPTLVSLHLI